MMYRRWIYLWGICLASFSLRGQEAKLSLTPDSILIGQQAEVKIWVDYEINSDSLQVIWPSLPDDWIEGIEIVSRGKIDTIAAVDENNPLLFRQEMQLNITAFDSGFYAIEPLQFVVSGLEVETPAALLSVYYPEVDLQSEIKDIKDIYSVSFTWKDWLAMYWTYVVSSLVLVILVFFLIKRLKKGPKQVEKVEKVVVAPVVPAHLIALEKLDHLEGEKLWQNDKLKEYYSELTGIFREYLENRYDIQALEETSDEILQELRRKAISGEHMEKIRELLLVADLVKFAKEKPLPREHEKAMKSTREFVEFSKLEDSESV